MTDQAGWGVWVWIVLSIVFMGPMMRMIFGRGGSYTGLMGERESGRKSRIKQTDVARLEAAIDDRDLVIEDLQHRLSEMESRLDFTERLLSERVPAER